MANFALDVNSPQGEIISSLNYALVNLNGSSNIANVLVTNPNGSITSNGNIISWQYRYINIRYAQNATGSVGFSSVPTNATYYGIQNTPDAIPTTVNNPANYTWTQVAGGFGTNKFLFYKTVGGYQIQFYIGIGNPGAGFVETVNGQAIDLTVLTVATGAPGSNGVTASVSPSQIVFPQQANYQYIPTSTIMSASFAANLNSICTASLYANVNTAGNVTISLGYVDPSIQVTSLNSNTTANVVTITFTQANTSATGTGVVSVQSIGINNNNAGVSTFTVTAYALGNTAPYTPIPNTGSWNFGSTPPTGTPPLSYTNNFSLGFSSVGTDSQVNTWANLVNGIPYYTAFPTSYASGTHTPPSGTISNYGNVFQANLIVSGSSPALVDIIMVGGGEDGYYALTANTTPPPTWSVYEYPAGDGGNVIVLSNVSLVNGYYNISFARGASTALAYQSNNAVIAQATPGQRNGQQNGNLSIVAGRAGGINGALGNTGTYYTPPGPGVGDETGNYYGGTGIPDPWNAITWVGQISGNVAYFGGGGSAGKTGNNTITTGGLGGGGTGGYTYGTPSGNIGLATSGAIGTGGGGGGGSVYHSDGTAGPSASGAPGLFIVRPHTLQQFTWTLTQPATTATQQVYSSQALAFTPNTTPQANVTNLIWTTPIVSSAIAIPQITITYPQGQYITNNQGIYTPTPVGNVVTLIANVKAVRSNTILAAIDQVTSYFTANGHYTITSNSATAFNANALVFGSISSTQYNITQPVTYTDIGGTTTGLISESLLVTTQGNIGANGFIPMAYVISNVDPTSANTLVLNAQYSSPRTNIYPPNAIGVGVAPVANDVAQFYYPPSDITSVQIYDGTTWSNVVGEVISGSLFVTGTITASKLAANDIYAINIISTNANFGNTQSPGYWLAAANGDAHFGGNISVGDNLTVGVNAKIGDNLTVGNSATIGRNLTVGNNAVIGGNLTVAGLINGGSLAANVVNSTNIVYNAITTNNIAPGAVTPAQLGPGTSSTVSANEVGSGNFSVSSPVAGNWYDAGCDVYIPITQTSRFLVSGIASPELIFGSPPGANLYYGLNWRVVCVDPSNNVTYPLTITDDVIASNYFDSVYASLPAPQHLSAQTYTITGTYHLAIQLQFTNALSGPAPTTFIDGGRSLTVQVYNS